LSEPIGDLCRRVLTASLASGERRGVRFDYTRPSPSKYPWQWYWDSCFAAIAWRRFDAERPRKELETLLAAMRDDGFIGHVIFWDRPISLRRLTYYNVSSRRAEMTGTIQPPLLAWAWRIGVGDPREEPRIARHHEWLRANRDLEGDGLLWLVQPDESGLDSSPKFDPVWGYRSHANWGFPLLVAVNRMAGWDARKIRDRGRPVVCEVMTNVLWNLGRMAHGEKSITPALVDRLWDESRGLFLDEVQPGGARPNVSTWAALSPLALPDLPEEIGRRLIEEHLLDRRRYAAPYGIPSVSMDEPSFRPGWHLFRCWRGPAWLCTAWLLLPALRRAGYEQEADRILAGHVELVERHGFREYYNPLTGDGLAARHFGWSTLLVDLLPRPGGPPDRAPDEWPAEGTLLGEAWAMSREAASALGGALRLRS
jgi:Mannosylglycerate hydrolase MGH1-like glycoside hydrolase domain